MLDQVENAPESRQVVGQLRLARVQPEAPTRVVDAHARRALVRLDAQRVQVTRVRRVPHQERANLFIHNTITIKYEVRVT